MKKPVEKTTLDRADTTTDEAERSSRALPPSQRVPIPPPPGTAAAAFLSRLNAVYEADQDPDDSDLPRAMRLHMRRILEQDR